VLLIVSGWALVFRAQTPQETMVPVPSHLESLVRQSRFIFRGTFQTLKAANMPTVPVSDLTAVVKIDTVLLAPKDLGDLTGKDVTILLRDTYAVEQGQQAIFFATSWMYGTSIALREIDRTEGRGDLRDFRQHLTVAIQQAADAELSKRLAQAELVVVGKVARTRPAPRSKERGPISFHTPNWWEAVLDVVAVEKGSLTGNTVTILFPNTSDRKWLSCPRFTAAQEGIWILHKQQAKGPHAIPGYTALDPLDFQASDQRQRITNLLKGT
jgi:hypothetical protein